MSPQAACRLAALGFEHVYDYMPGKVDWLARGLPTEGDQEPAAQVKDVVRDDAVRARLDEPVGQVRERVERSPYGFALVSARDGTLLGRLRRSHLDGDPETLAGQVMEPGPSTVRLDTPAGNLAKRLRDRGLKTAVVTDPEGKLVGIARRPDLES